MLAKTKQIVALLVREFILLGIAGFFLFGGFSAWAAWTEPVLAPPGGNVPVPVYSQGTGQAIDGDLHVGTPGSYATGLQGTGSTSGIQGNSSGNALFGNLSEVKVAVIVWERPGDRIIATFRGFAALPRGSMDTIDAPRRLVAAAMDDVARQLEAWVKASGEKK